MTFDEYRDLVRADLYRYGGARGARGLLARLLDTPGFAFTLWLRSCRFARSRPLLRFSVYPLLLALYVRATYRFGISIPLHTEIGRGLYIGHFGGIVVHGDARIGSFCNLSQGVSLGQVNRGERRGTPTVGDRVYIGPGAKVVGKVEVGAGAAIGANAVVTRDVEANGVAVGVPAKTISQEGSDGYVEFTDI